MTPLLVIPVTTEKIKSFAIAADTAANIAPQTLTSSCYVSCFTVSVTPSNNTLESSNDLMILIISSISSFEINGVNSFPAFATLFPLILLSILFIAFEAAFKAILPTNPGKHLQPKEHHNSILLFFLPKLPTDLPTALPNHEPGDPAD